MNALILPNYGKELTHDCTQTICGILEKAGCGVKTYPLCWDCASAAVEPEKLEDCLRMAAECDVIIAVGGDGTIMHAAKFAAEAGRPILGVNTGRLGFIAGMESTEPELITNLVSGDYTTEQRMLLDVEVIRGGEVIMLSHAINDAVVSRGALSKIITIKVSHNGQQAMEMRADGLIISTPTGSTAYALSAGGPVIDPSFRCIEVTPVCPHSLMDRAIIFDSDSELTIETDRRREDYITLPEDRVNLAVDGENACEMQPGDIVRIRRSALSAEFIVIRKQSFANLLMQKFIN